MARAHNRLRSIIAQKMPSVSRENKHDFSFFGLFLLHSEKGEALSKQSELYRDELTRVVMRKIYQRKSGETVLLKRSNTGETR
jgi:hypothetical protein